MDKTRVQWRGDNEEEVFEFARPCAFRDYTDPRIPMRLRSKSGLFKWLVQIGDWIVRQPDGSFLIEKGEPNAAKG